MAHGTRDMMVAALEGRVWTGDRWTPVDNKPSNQHRSHGPCVVGSRVVEPAADIEAEHVPGALHQLECTAQHSTPEQRSIANAWRRLPAIRGTALTRMYAPCEQDASSIIGTISLAPQFWVVTGHLPTSPTATRARQHTPVHTNTRRTTHAEAPARSIQSPRRLLNGLPGLAACRSSLAWACRTRHAARPCLGAGLPAAAPAPARRALLPGQLAG